MAAIRHLFLLLAPLLGFMPPVNSYAANGLPIIVYHQVLNQPNEMPEGETAISLAHFKEHMHYLAKHGYRTLSMAETVEAIRTGHIPDKAIAIQFDDGWANQKSVLPVLEQYGFKATFWIIAKADPRYGYFSPNDIRQIADNPLFDVQSHTLTHPWDPNNNLMTWTAGNPPGKSIDDARKELTESKRILEGWIGKPVSYLAWPCGWYNDALIELAVEAGYSALATIDAGFNEKGGDLLHIRRAMIDGRCDIETFEHTLQSPLNQNCVSATKRSAADVKPLMVPHL